MRWNRILQVALASALFSGPLLFAQQEASARPVLPASVLGAQLIAWTDLQQPQPPEYTPNNSQLAPPQAHPQPTGQAFTGTVVKDGTRYVLKGTDNVNYQLDDQEKARNYEGKHVKIAGTLDDSTNTLHISSIELIS